MPHSLKWTIQLWHALVLGAVLAALGVGFYHYEKGRRISSLDRKLDDKLLPLLGLADRGGDGPPQSRGPDRPGPPASSGPPELSEPPGLSESRMHVPGWTRRNQAPSADRLRQQGKSPDRIFEELYIPLGYYFRFERRGSGEVVLQSSNFPADLELPHSPVTGYHLRLREERYRELLHGSPHLVALVGVDIEDMHAELTRLKINIFATLMGIFILGVALGQVFVARALRPLKSIEETSAAIADGELTRRIPTVDRNSSSELDSLAENLNHTFAHLESLFQRQLRFTADASHELRTPLTALMAQLQFGRKRRRTSEEYERILAVCERSSERIQRITEQLMELSRYDAGRVELDYDTLPLDTLLQDVADDLQAYVAENGSSLHTELSPGLICCDAFRLEQVIINLVNNALQHNAAPVAIRVCARCESDHAVIEVIDNGRGIQPDNLDKLFDRFFQEEFSRSKQKYIQNSGLGLAISKAIIGAHKGTLEVSSLPGIETKFTIRLPRHLDM